MERSQRDLEISRRPVERSQRDLERSRERSRRALWKDLDGLWKYLNELFGKIPTTSEKRCSNASIFVVCAPLVEENNGVGIRPTGAYYLALVRLRVQSTRTTVHAIRKNEKCDMEN